MNRRHFHLLILTILAAALLLAACAPGAGVATPVTAITPEPTVTITTGPVAEPTTAPTSTPGEPVAALSARQVLAQQLHLDLTDITIISVEAVEWPDTCLGVESAGTACAEVITPGYRVVLEAGGKQYVFHTDEAGETVRLAGAPSPEIGDAAITWTQTTDNVCETAVINPDTIVFGPCNGLLIEGELAFENRAADLAYFTTTFAPFQAGTAAGTLQFRGEGEVTATPAQQRMIAEWARLVAQEAAAGHSGASWGLVFAWHREGGIAGFCDDVTVYITGDATVSLCGGMEPRDLGRVRLNADQLAAIYHWVDTVESFEFEHKGPVVPDAMTIRLVFSGAGEAEATDADIQAIQELAADLWAQARATPTPVEQSAARETLVTHHDYIELRPKVRP